MGEGEKGEKEEKVVEREKGLSFGCLSPGTLSCGSNKRSRQEGDELWEICSITDII